MTARFPIPLRAVGALLLLAVLATVPYLGAVRGEFVYDDRVQILENSLIQRPGALATALARDVWAFKGDRDEAWSNYYRPAFVLWLAAQWRLFGAHPLGWHLASLALHAVVTLLALQLLRRLDLSFTEAWLAAAIFAVHPVHVESVAWISGSPDLLMALGTLGCLTLEARPGGATGVLQRPASLACAALALGSKETAVVLPLVIVALAWTRSRDLPPSARARRAARTAFPYAVLAALFLVARQAILAGFTTATPWTLRWIDLAVSLPSVAAFYLRQVFLPVWIGPTYPLRSLTTATAGWTNFIVPLVVVVAVVGLLWRATKRSPQRPLYFALACLPLAPAFHLSAFMQEQLVHDRYLYLPLLGWIGLAVAAVAVPFRAPTVASRQRPSVALVFGLASVALLAARTVALAPDYRDERRLFRSAVASDPSSSFHWAQLASAELRFGRDADALEAANRALAIEPVTTALVVRAEVAMKQRRLAEAARDLETVLAGFPDQTAAVERLAIVYASQGRNGAAIDLLRRSREIAPWRRCSLTGNLAVALYLEGQPKEALKELEGLRASATADRLDTSPACGLALFRLGNLYLELGRSEAARGAFEAYLRQSDASTAAFHASARNEAARALAALATKPPAQ